MLLFVFFELADSENIVLLRNTCTVYPNTSKTPKRTIISQQIIFMTSLNLIQLSAIICYL